MHSNPRIAALVARAETLLIMATEAQFNAALDKLETALTTEIAEIVEELKKTNIPDDLLARVEALSTRVEGIIEEGKPPGDDPGELPTPTPPPVE